MDQLLDHLNMTAKVDCQEAQRAVLACMNGLAALYIIAEDNNSAAEKVDIQKKFKRTNYIWDLTYS